MKRSSAPNDDNQGKDASARPLISSAVQAPWGVSDKAVFASAIVMLALAVGFVVGAAVFLVLSLSNWLTGALWEGYLSGGVGIWWFPLAVCSAGGLVIGVWTLVSGDSVRPLHEVMGEFKRTGTYEVRPARGAVSFLLPLVFGGSIGFEAGLTGLIVGACCWIRDRLKLAGLRAAAMTDVTIAACVSAIFGTPLAGIVAGAQSAPGDSDEALEAPDPSAYDMRRGVKVALYTAAAFGAFVAIRVLSAVLGSASGLPRFGGIEAQGAQTLWAVVALVGAYALTWVYYASQCIFGHLSQRLGGGRAATVAKPLVAGVLLGAAACLLPYVLFPGEEQAHMLMESWGGWAAAALVGTGVLKAAATPMCLSMGWMGGNFFPSIFSGLAFGYGLAMFTGADPMLMVTVTVTAHLACVLRQPLLTVAILVLVFPLESIAWMGVAAVIGAFLPLPKALVHNGQ